MSEIKALSGEMETGVIGVFKCPRCGEEPESLTNNCCPFCNANLVDYDLEGLVVKKEVSGFRCPKCHAWTSNSPSNQTGQKTVDGKMAIMCPDCHIILNGLPLIHHGNCNKDFEPSYEGTDYFAFRHKSCLNLKNRGQTVIYAVLVDNGGRIIFNLLCKDCNTVDALKTHTYFLGISPQDSIINGKITYRHKLEHIYLSPDLRMRIAKHSWDNL